MCVTLAWLLLFNAGVEQPSSPEKPPVDEKLPVRVEIWGTLSREGQPQATVLRSFLTVLDPEARSKSRYLFSRCLIELADGQLVALYHETDLTDEAQAQVRHLMVHPQSGAWLLIAARYPVEGSGYRAWVEAADGEGAEERTLVSFETRRLRVPAEWESVLPKSAGPSLVRQEEPGLLALLQDLRRLLTGPENRLLGCDGLESMAGYLGLGAIQAAAGEERILKQRAVNDDPKVSEALPMVPDFEKKFGRWATWRQLPVLKRRM